MPQWNIMWCQKHPTLGWVRDDSVTVQSCPWCEIERLRAECRRLRVKCGPSEMIESDCIDGQQAGEE